ncbi:MAG: IS1 family transposase [Magnetococcales bacterium]|nr:IS1 family transposase [Magnetococcales bacterium]MBF0116142.1 IS1 family transposase [Magnetococcales bacterium]
MAVVEVRCPECDSLNVVKYGKQPNGAQRFICQNPSCTRRVFLLNYRSKPSASSSRQQIIDLALNGADVEETARLLRLPTQTVLEVFQMLSRFSLPSARPLQNRKRVARPQAAAG